MIKDNLNEAKSKFEEGIKLFEKKDYELAEKCFSESLNLVPERLSVISNLIKIYIVTKQIQKLSEILAKYKNLNTEKEILFGEAYNFFLKKILINQLKFVTK